MFRSEAVKNLDLIMAISSNVQRWILEFHGRLLEIIYPSVTVLVVSSR